MKLTKIIRIFSIAIILSLLVVALPATPAQAVRALTLIPAEGSVGDTITIAGDGFSASTETTEKYINIFFSSDEASTIHNIDNQVTHYELVKEGVWIDESGEFITTFTVPVELNDGTGDDQNVETGTTYFLYATRIYTNPLSPATRIGAFAEFNVTGGELALDPDSGPAGTELEITGTAFSASKSLTIEYDGSEVDIDDGDDETDNDGEFVSVILIPESTAGVHTITITVSGSEIEAEFTVEPETILNPTSGATDATVTITGTGFGKRKEVIIWFDDNIEMANETTNSKGSFTTTFDVPEMGAGIYNVDTEDEDDNTDKAKFTVTVPPPTPSPTPPVLMETTISGSIWEPWKWRVFMTMEANGSLSRESPPGTPAHCLPPLPNLVFVPTMKWPS